MPSQNSALLMTLLSQYFIYVTDTDSDTDTDADIGTDRDTYLLSDQDRTIYICSSSPLHLMNSSYCIIVRVQ